jgi:energy-coupling factor transporter ATP-binding protein EcfA2
MRIESLHIVGFRSLRDVTLSPLRDINVLYGPNGSGKSNVVAAVDYLFLIAQALKGTRADWLYLEGRNWLRGPILDRDFNDRGHGVIVLSATVTGLGDAGEPVTLSVRMDRDDKGTRYAWGGDGPSGFEQLGDDPIRVFNLVEAARYIGPELRPDSNHQEAAVFSQPPTQRTLVRRKLDEGRVQEALHIALTSPDSAIRADYRRMAKFLQSAPLSRPPFDPVYDGQSKAYEVFERTNGDEDRPLSHCGLGVVQLYAVIAGLLLSGAPIAALEEPEAHLHAPTSGRQLRQVLGQLVADGHLSQLFIATHSNLFDLDPTGYWDVSLDEHGDTQITWSEDLLAIDRKHLWEPGPARHALQGYLAYADPEATVFRDEHGAVSAEAMKQHLADHSEVAQAFLEAINGAAQRFVGTKARRA